MIRIEDTDQSRVVEGAVEAQLDALSWLGADWDEGPDIGGDYGPYYQSERLDMYIRVADELVANGHAYRCYCSSKRLSELRAEQSKRKESTGYDRRCRDLSDDEKRQIAEPDEIPVIRFKMPLDGTTSINDLIRGQVSFDNSLIDDFVMLKSDGFPTYHLASVVDDHHMEISHVMRSEEWLSSLPRHVQLYAALGWEPPLFAHLPLILAPDRSKLSKRHGATSVLEYREMGYLPDAMVNFLSLLGWSLDDKTELISREDLIGNFSIERINKAGAIFSTEKLDWMNGQYIRQMTDEQLADALLDYWRRYPPDELENDAERSVLIQVVPLIRERLKTLNDAAKLIPFFFNERVQYESAELVQKGMDDDTTRHALSAAHGGLKDLVSFDRDAIEGSLRPLATDLGMKVGQLLGSIRVATSGLKVSPPLFESLEVLGRERTLKLIGDAVERLN